MPKIKLTKPAAPQKAAAKTPAKPAAKRRTLALVNDDPKVTTLSEVAKSPHARNQTKFDRAVAKALEANMVSVETVKAELLDGAIRNHKLMPLTYMLDILNNETMGMAVRFEAAKAAAPYVHAKLASVTNLTPNDSLDADIKRSYLAGLQAMQNAGPLPPSLPPK